MSMFRPATREKLKLRMALMGPSGSGKTFTALRLAHALGDKVAVCDTEERSASKYVGESNPDGGTFGFDVVELDSYEPRRFVEVIRAAERGGYDVLVIDSLSHAWMGAGGMLELVDNAAKRAQGNSWAGWKAAKPEERALWEALLHAKLHLICTFRVKTEWVTEKDPRTGKSAPRKVGLKAEQRDGLEYEFDVVCDLDTEHNGIVSKSRCSAIADKCYPHPGRNMAEPLARWLDAGTEAKAPEVRTAPAQTAAPVASSDAALDSNGRHPSFTDAERKAFMAHLSSLGLDYDTEVKPWCEAKGHPKPSAMPQARRAQLARYLAAHVEDVRSELAAYRAAVEATEGNIIDAETEPVGGAQ
jgi:hypothetical protein